MCVPVAHTFWTRFLWLLAELGEQQGLGGAGQHTCPAILSSPAGHVGATPRTLLGWNEKQCHPCSARSVALGLLASTSRPSLQERPDFHGLRVCVCVCVCVCARTRTCVTCVSGHRLLGAVLFQIWVPLPTVWTPHSQCSWVSQPHTITPIAGDLLNFLCPCLTRGTPPFVQAPKSRVVFIPADTSLLLVVSFSPRGVGRRQAPQGGRGWRWLFPCHWPFAACFTRRVLSMFA